MSQRPRAHPGHFDPDPRVGLERGRRERVRGAPNAILDDEWNPIAPQRWRAERGADIVGVEREVEEV
jgi:hypothetical protein